tara:strand:+ start:60 stop:227 length:168 start_codon:yes stop_codon:yes gene_type:complete
MSSYYYLVNLSNPQKPSYNRLQFANLKSLSLDNLDSLADVSTSMFWHWVNVVDVS